ncbi:PREDICTED: reticulon-like protein B21 isoform X2 [Nelumbo nucifera]|uniref:Reticulon-like protein n=2 Tax=Nelumbo nucifera TaxID=4432 RepID=A0A1U8BG09_NELNU|nr:PREDICTED: reticulon-like protein B21 isoform X2 [Nelumbo nucifera]DAD45244.1 TPA_asm: hypothetical protein HUJ06_003474 [Nelumbo nucifera]
MEKIQTARKRTGARKVVAGSVWESRMRSDEFKGGIKVFNGEENTEEGGGRRLQVYKKLNRTLSVGVDGKRKKWKSESAGEIERSPLQMRKVRSQSNRFPAELSVSLDGIEKSTIQVEKSPIQLRKTRSESIRSSDESCKELGMLADGIERSPIQMKKIRSESPKVPEENCKEFGVCKEKTISTSFSNVGEIGSPEKLGLNGDGVDGDEESDWDDEEDVAEIGIEKKSVDVKEIRMEEQKPQSAVNEEKRVDEVHETSISTSSNINEQPTPVADQPQPVIVDIPVRPQKVVDEEEKIQLTDETPKPLSPIVNKQPPPAPGQPVISRSPVKPQKVVNEEKKIAQVNETPKPISPVLNKNPSPVADHSLIAHKFAKLKRAMDEESKLQQGHDKSAPISPNVNKQRRSVFARPVIDQDLRKSPPKVNGKPETHGKLQSIVDLVMWRDVSRSAFVFGIGTFFLLSSSFTKDLNFSLISTTSYLGLIYLALIFVYKSILCRGAIDIDDSNQTHVVGEEEAIWLIKLILPYLNEFLLKLRGLFSGDPSTTMKLAILLFVLARCGSSITVWKMAKLGFFGVFTLPKICSSYSTQLTGYGKFWIRRFRDAWNSCAHKKAVAFGIFTLVWNLSSIVARVWAVFMLVVAFKYYQQSVIMEDWGEEETGGEGSISMQEEKWGQKQGGGPTIVEIVKEKKAS